MPKKEGDPNRLNMQFYNKGRKGNDSDIPNKVPYNTTKYLSPQDIAELKKIYPQHPLLIQYERKKKK
jgi:hypothetical protein